MALHELAHVCTLSVGHKTEFWDNFRFLLEQARATGLHDPVDYSRAPQTYCGMRISDSPLYAAE